MRRILAWVIIGLASIGTRQAAAAQADLARLFPFEGDIIAESDDGDEDQLLRLVLPPPVIAAARADLSDVRVFAKSGEEVPFVVDSGLRAGEVRQATQSTEPKVLDAHRDQFTFEGEPTLYHEEYELEAPTAPAEGWRWELIVDSSKPEFIRAIGVAALAQDGAATPLIEDATVFRLPGAGAERTWVSLPPFEAARIRVVLDGTDGSFLTPRLRLRTTAVFDGGERAVMPLEVVSQTKENGKTIVEAVRPDGVVPDVLRIETSTPSYYRAVDVFDVRQGGAAEQLGRGAFFRIKVRKPVEQTELRIAGARGDRLRIEIGDADSPPLRDLKIFAEVRRPALYFHLPVRGSAAAGVLRYGGGRVERARYDLEQLAPEDGRRGQTAALSVMLLERGQTVRAELRNLRANPNFDSSPLLAFAMQPGATVDAAEFSHRRALQVSDSPDGLTRLVLRPEDLAVSRADLGDLRIVDAEGRQWPYLLQRGATVGSTDVGIGRVVRDHGVTRYELRLPYEPLPIETLQLATGDAFFRRAYRLVGRGADGRERTLATGQLNSTPQHTSPRIDLQGERVQHLTLHIDDGDEAPIAIESASASVRVPEIYLVAPRGSYTLLIGNPEADAPRYDLAEVRDAVLAVTSAPASTEGLEANPVRGWRQRVLGGDGRALQRVTVWAVLGAAVVALALVTVRLVRREGSS